MHKWIIILFCFYCSSLDSKGQSIETQFAELQTQLDKVSLSKKNQSQAIIHNMYELVTHNQDDFLYAQILYNQSTLNDSHGIIDTLLFSEINTLLKREKISLKENTYLTAALKDNLLVRGDFIGAYKLSLQVLDKAKQLNDSLLVSKTLNSLGEICSYVDLYNMSENYYKEAELFVPSGSPSILYLAKANLYSLNLLRNDVENNTVYLDSIMSLINFLSQNEFDEILPLLYSNTSIYFSQKEDFDTSLNYLTKAQELMKDNYHKQAIITFNIGSHYTKKHKDYRTALKYFFEAEQILESNNNIQQLAPLYMNISRSYEHLGKIDSALFYARKEQELKNRNTANAQMMDTYQKYIITTLKASENELVLAQAEIDLKDKQLIIIVISALLILLLLILMLQRRRTQRLIKETEAKEIINRLEKEQLLQKEKTESKLREVTSYSLILSSKNEVLNHIVKLAEKLPFDNRPIQNEIIKVAKNNLQMDNEWQDFTTHFNKVHPRFFEKLQTLYPTLTQYDLRLCAYIRMGLSIKEIAQMQNVMPESIRTGRYRIRKKINLDKDDDLDDYIKGIDLE